MVHIEIPTHYTGSPSSLSGTPHVTINREVAADLDSTNAFEGPEKLLEVWFSTDERSLPASASPLGLKAVSQACWKDMLDLVNCQILSIVESRNVDAYLLSESSMFVFPHKLVLKTCGTTTLLLGLTRMLEIAALEAGFPQAKVTSSNNIRAAATPHRVFYSRKNFLFPRQQKGPHKSWRDEVAFLDNKFVGGSAYMIGKMNGEHWYLYIAGPGARLTPPSSPREDDVRTPTKFIDLKAVSNDGSDHDKTDETLEILMTDLDVDNARQFHLDQAAQMAQDNARKAHLARKDAIEHLGIIAEHNSSDPSIASGDTLINGVTTTDDSGSFDVFAQTSTDHSEQGSPQESSITFADEYNTEGHTLGSIVSEHCGLADLYPAAKYPDARIDSYLFTPCGFSANGVVPRPGDLETTHYWTVHVTPEPQFSYASFETNVPTRQTGRETVEMVAHVIDIFKPGHFSVTLFEAKTGDETYMAKRDKRMDSIKGYRRVDRIVHDLEGYELIFRYFEREDWKGGMPRLGERQLT